MLRRGGKNGAAGGGGKKDAFDSGWFNFISYVSMYIYIYESSLHWLHFKLVSGEMNDL